MFSHAIGVVVVVGGGGGVVVVCAEDDDAGVLDRALRLCLAGPLSAAAVGATTVR